MTKKLLLLFCMKLKNQGKNIPAKFHHTLPRMQVEKTIFEFPPSKRTAKNYLFQNEHPEFNLNPDYQTPMFKKVNQNDKYIKENKATKGDNTKGFFDCTA